MQEFSENTGQKWIVSPYLNVATEETNVGTNLIENLLRLSTYGMLSLEFKPVILGLVKEETEYPELTQKLESRMCNICDKEQ